MRSSNALTMALGLVFFGVAGCAGSPPPTYAQSSVLELPPLDHGAIPVPETTIAPSETRDSCDGRHNCDPPAMDIPEIDFELAAIVRALADAELDLDLDTCRTPRGPRGPGRVVVTFEASGNATRSEVVDAPFAGTTTGACVASRFLQVTVPDFKRRPAITVTARFTIE